MSKSVIKAAHALICAKWAAAGLSPGEEAELNKALNELNYASDAEIDRARSEYCLCSNDAIEVDEGAITSRGGDDGLWVQAWVWLADEEVA